MPARIGLLGGTFDPVHRGHLQLAAAALNECRFDQVLLVPSAHPPHKDGSRVLPFRHRLAMLELLDENAIACSGIEGELPAPTYTIDMLRAMRAICRKDSEFFFIIGSDAFLDLLSWKAYSDVLALVHIVLALRSGSDNRQICQFLTRIGYRQRGRDWFFQDGSQRVIFLTTTPEEISSSKIRARLRQGLSVRQWVPEQVVAYIETWALYQGDSEVGDEQ